MSCEATPLPELGDLKQRLGIPATSTANDEQLSWCLRVATAWVDDRVYVSDRQPGERHPEVVEAILIGSSRWYARRNSPEGISGWGELGVVRIMSTDPDVTSLLEYHLDYSKVAGIA